jgi:hypothetical protein
MWRVRWCRRRLAASAVAEFEAAARASSEAETVSPASSRVSPSAYSSIR